MICLLVFVTNRASTYMYELKAKPKSESTNLTYDWIKPENSNNEISLISINVFFFVLFVAYTRWPSVSGKPIWWLKFARLAFVASKLFMSWAALRWCELGRLPSLIISVGIGINIDCIWRSLFTLFSWFCWFLFGSLRMPGGRLLGLLL